MNRQPFTGVLIQHGQAFQPPPLRGLVMHKVIAPDMVRIHGARRTVVPVPRGRRFRAFFTPWRPKARHEFMALRIFGESHLAVLSLTDFMVRSPRSDITLCHQKPRRAKFIYIYAE